jgi:hypothetical protein
MEHPMTASEATAAFLEGYTHGIRSYQAAVINECGSAHKVMEALLFAYEQSRSVL